MKLITKAIERKLAKNLEHSRKTGETAHSAPLKLFDPYGRWTMYVFEKDGDRLYGFVVSPLAPDCDEWGYSSLTEIESITAFGGRPRIERDRYFDGVTAEQIRNGERP